MGDIYYGDYGYYGEFDLVGFLLAYFAVLGLAGLISIAAYVLQSLSLYNIAKRRCIKKPWLAWLPVGYSWILGSISDQYRYVAKGQVKNKRKALLVLEILCAVMGAACFALMIVALGEMFSTIGDWQMRDDVFGAIVGTMLGAWGAAMAVYGLRIAIMVISYMADYDLYRSCEPKNAVVYLVLGIIFSITRPVFMIVCSKKDEGMPPRKAQTAPVAVPKPQPVQEPWEKPAEE